MYLQIPVAIAIHGNKLIETLAFSKVDFPPHQRRHAAVGKRKGPNGVFLHAPASPNIPQSNNEIASAPLMSRRERKNKYTKFSKVQQKDPLEILIAESGRKNQEIVAEQSQYLMTKTIPEPEVEPLPRVEFPDTKGIDVSDKKASCYQHFMVLSFI